MLTGSKKDDATMVGYFDGAFPGDDFLPYEMRYASVYWEFLPQYMSGFVAGKYHRYLRWKKGMEPNWW